MINNFNFSLFSVHTIILLLILTSVQSHNKLTSTTSKFRYRLLSSLIKVTHLGDHVMSMLSFRNIAYASPVMVDHFNFRSRLKLILVFISFFAIIFSFYSFIFLKIILVLLLLTVN